MSPSAKVRSANDPPPAAATIVDEAVVASCFVEGSVSSSMVSMRPKDEVMVPSRLDAAAVDSHSACDPSGAWTLLTPPLPPSSPLLLLAGGLDLQSLAR